MTVESARNISELRAQQAELAKIDAKRPEKQEPILNFRNSWAFFSDLMLDLIGTDLPSAVANHFGSPVTAQMVRDWRNGRCGIPAWVLEKTHQRLVVARTDALQKLSLILPGPGYTGDIHRRYGPKRKSPATVARDEASKP